MAVAKKVRHERVKWVTGTQAMALVDARAKRVLNMSGQKFLEKWNAGKYRNMDSGDCPGVIELALLAPQKRSRRARKRQQRSRR